MRGEIVKNKKFIIEIVWYWGRIKSKKDLSWVSIKQNIILLVKTKAKGVRDKYYEAVEYIEVKIEIKI